MGVIAYYARLTAPELAGLVLAPTRLRHIAHALRTSEGARKADPSGPRFLNLDKAWDRIGSVLDEYDFSIDIVRGEKPLGYLTAEHVREAAKNCASWAPTRSQLSSPGAVLWLRTPVDAPPRRTLKR